MNENSENGSVASSREQIDLEEEFIDESDIISTADTCNQTHCSECRRSSGWYDHESRNDHSSCSNDSCKATYDHKATNTTVTDEGNDYDRCSILVQRSLNGQLISIFNESRQ